jgi:hypothetical protein
MLSKKISFVYINDLCNMLLEEIQNWTKADWLAFDSYRVSALAPTPEEIQQQEITIQQNIVNRTKSALDLYGIVFIGNELDFSNLYEQYIK